MRVCSSTALASYTSFGFGWLLFDAMLPLLTLCCRFSLDLFAKRACRRNCFLQHALFLSLELSSQVQQRIEENLKRGLPAEAFARSTVEFGNEGCYLSLAEVLHINRLGTVFTD